MNMTFFGVYRKGTPLHNYDTNVYEWRLVAVAPTKEGADGLGYALGREQMQKVGFVDSFETRPVSLEQAREAWGGKTKADGETEKVDVNKYNFDMPRG